MCRKLYIIIEYTYTSPQIKGLSTTFWTVWGKMCLPSLLPILCSIFGHLNIQWGVQITTCHITEFFQAPATSPFPGTVFSNTLTQCHSLRVKRPILPAFLFFPFKLQAHKCDLIILTMLSTFNYLNTRFS